MLNIEKIKETFDNRNKSDGGITSVAFYCMETENWYDNLTKTINDKLKIKPIDYYQAYECHRHITIMGLEGLDISYVDEISKLLSEFPKIKIKNAKFSLLENGLVVGEFYPVCDDAQKLELFRKSFESFGVSYKHPQNIQKLHSVLGQIRPDKIETVFIDDIENSINEILKEYKDCKVDNYIEKCDLKIVKYKTTSLNNIDSSSLSSNEFNKLENFFDSNNTDIIDNFINMPHSNSIDDLLKSYNKLKKKIYQDSNLKDKLKMKISNFELHVKQMPKTNVLETDYKDLSSDYFDCYQINSTTNIMTRVALSVQDKKENRRQIPKNILIELFFHERSFEKLEKTINDFSNPTPIKEKLDLTLSKLKSAIYKCYNNFSGNINEFELRLLKFLSDPNSIDKWNEELIYKFWRYVDLKILHESITGSLEYKFMFYVFPGFIESSFLALFDENKVINTDKDMIFTLAHFMGKVNFKKAVFNHKVNFNLTRFYEKSAITNCFFKGEVYFRKTVFDNDIDFSATRFDDISLNDIQFPKHKLYKIKMERVTLEKAIWTEFNNPKNINQIEAGRETFSRFKQANAEIGNFIDSNLFFARESEVYRLESWKNFRGKGQENDNSRQWSALPDAFSFAIAKWTSSYGQSWIKPLIWLVVFGVLASFIFIPNLHYVATPNTPFFAVEDKKENKMISSLYSKSFLSKDDVNKTIFGQYVNKNYYDSYNFDFQDDSKMKLKDNLWIRFSFYLSCVVPTFLPVEQQYIVKSENPWIYLLRLGLNIVMWYLLAAFGFAIKNRTRRS